MSTPDRNDPKWLRELLGDFFRKLVEEQRRINPKLSLDEIGEKSFQKKGEVSRRLNGHLPVIFRNIYNFMAGFKLDVYETFSELALAAHEKAKAEPPRLQERLGAHGEWVAARRTEMDELRPPASPSTGDSEPLPESGQSTPRDGLDRDRPSPRRK